MKYDKGILKNIKQEILLNPYRVLGVTCEASVRDITRRSSRLKKYLLAGENPADHSFAVLDALQRKSEDIESAVHAISTDESRLSHALFWFWKHNEITDVAALELLGDNKSKEALDVWGRLVTNQSNGEFKEVTAKNISAFHNWSILKFILAVLLPDESVDHMQEAIQARLIMLDSPFWEEFKSCATDKTYHIEQEQVELIFLNLILDMSDISSLASVFRQPFIARTTFLDKYFYSVQDRISSITKRIKDTKSQHKDTIPELAKQIATSAQKELRKTKKIISSEQYNQLSDIVASTLVQEGISYFNYYCKEENNKHAPKNFDLEALNILDLARKFSRSKSLEQKIDTNYQSIHDYKYKEGMLALYALKEAWRTCVDIESRNNFFLSMMGRRYEVNKWKLSQMIGKFVSVQSLSQLAHSRNNEAISEADALLEKLAKYIDTSYWRKHLDEENRRQKCLVSYEKFPDNSMERLFALLSYMKKHTGDTLLVIPLLKKEMSGQMIQTIARASNSQQLELWNALLEALRDSDFLTTIEKKLIEGLPERSELLSILKTRAKKRLIRARSIVGIIALSLGLLIYGIHIHLLSVEKDQNEYAIFAEKNTLESYEAYLKTSPNPRYADSAREQIRRIKEAQERAKKEAEEKEFWDNANKNKRYQDYLDKYPSGKFVSEAEKALEQQRWGTERAAWNTATSDNNLVGYKKYLQLYPTGAHIKQAEKQVEQTELKIKINNYCNRSKGTLPSPTDRGRRSGSNARFNIENDTSGKLTMYFSGPTIKQVEINKGKNKDIYLPPGTYQVVAVTSDDDPYANIITFEVHDYAASYSIHSYYAPQSYNHYNYRRRY